MPISRPASTSSRQARTASGPFSRIVRRSARGVGQEPVGGNHAVDQPDPPGLLGVDHAAGEQQLERPAAADQPREPDRAAVARTDPELDLGLSEARGLAGDADVAGHGQLAPAAQGEAVDRRHHRLPALLQPPHHPLARARARLAVRRALRSDLPDVRARDERLGPGTGEEHASDIALALDPAGGVVQLRDDRGVERVELVRPVHRDRGDAVREIEEQRGIGHGDDRAEGVRMRGHGKA